MKTKLALFTLAFLSLAGKAQVAAAEPEMADKFRSEGKIYVVITVIAITFVCLIAYLVYLDIKLRKLEKNKQS